VALVVPEWGLMEAAADPARATDLVAEAARVGATVRELGPEEERPEDLEAAAGLAAWERIRERVAKFLKVGLEPGAQAHPDFMAADRLARRVAVLWKAAPSKWVALQVALVVAPQDPKAARGILWEGAVVVRRSIRTQVVSGLREKARLRPVLVERAAAARAASLVWPVLRLVLELPADLE
jgi:hypothetical protein